MADLKTKINKIELVIDDEAFYFLVTDERSKGFGKFSEDMRVSMLKLSAELKNGEDSLETKINNTNTEMEKVFDYLLGDGSYKRIYQKAPSVFSMVSLLIDVLDAVKDELDNLDKAEANKKDQLMQKYRKKHPKR